MAVFISLLIFGVLFTAFHRDRFTIVDGFRRNLPIPIDLFNIIDLVCQRKKYTLYCGIRGNKAVIERTVNLLLVGKSGGKILPLLHNSGINL